MTLVCTICAASYDPDDAPSACELCDGKLISSAVKAEREREEAWERECAWEAYHKAKDAANAEPTYTAGTLFRRQAS